MVAARRPDRKPISPGPGFSMSLPFGPFLLVGCLVLVFLAGVGHGNHVAALL
jgi:hypothetical protein